MAPQAIYCQHPHSHPYAHVAQMPQQHQQAHLQHTQHQHQHKHAIYQQQQHYGSYAITAGAGMTLANASNAGGGMDLNIGIGGAQSDVSQQNTTTIYQQITPHMSALLQNSGHVNNPHSIYQPLTAAVTQNSIYIPSLNTVRRSNILNSANNNNDIKQPEHHQHQQQQQMDLMSTTQQQQQQQQHPTQHHQQPTEMHLNIRSHVDNQVNQLNQLNQLNQVSNIMQGDANKNNNNNVVGDMNIYNHDKNMYKCLTLRQGGKFDQKHKPSILNCPLPEIPKEVQQSPAPETTTSIASPHLNYSK